MPIDFSSDLLFFIFTSIETKTIYPSCWCCCYAGWIYREIVCVWCVSIYIYIYRRYNNHSGVRWSVTSRALHQHTASVHIYTILRTRLFVLLDGAESLSHRQASTHNDKHDSFDTEMRPFVYSAMAVAAAGRRGGSERTTRSIKISFVVVFFLFSPPSKKPKTTKDLTIKASTLALSPI